MDHQLEGRVDPQLRVPGVEGEVHLHRGRRLPARRPGRAAAAPAEPAAEQHALLLQHAVRPVPPRNGLRARLSLLYAVSAACPVVACLFLCMFVHRALEQQRRAHRDFARAVAARAGLRRADAAAEAGRAVSITQSIASPEGVHRVANDIFIDRNERLVDMTLTIPHGVLYPMCSMNVAFDRERIGPAFMQGFYCLP